MVALCFRVGNAAEMCCVNTDCLLTYMHAKLGSASMTTTL